MTESDKQRSTGYRGIGVAFMLLLPLATFAQPGPPPDPDIPITGIEFLLGGGALLGIRQLYARYKSSRKE